jgi:hypothetical protein
VPASAFSLPAGTAVNNQQVATAPAMKELLSLAYPNPFSERLFLDFELENASRSGLVEIYDNIGQLVKRQSVSTFRQGRNSLEISMKEIRLRPHSVYLVTIKIPGAETKRFRVMSR